MIKKTLLSLTLFSALTQAEIVRIDSQNVVLDTSTHKMWQDNNDAKTVKNHWQGARDYCQNLSLAGYHDWVLPDLYTLKDLYFWKNSLQNVASDSYWSSTPYADYSNYAWGINFGNGDENDYLKYNNAYVRCVRDSKLLTLSLHF